MTVVHVPHRTSPKPRRAALAAAAAALLLAPLALADPVAAKRAEQATAVAALCAGSLPAPDAAADPDWAEDALRHARDRAHAAACGAWATSRGAHADRLALVLVETALGGPLREAALALLRALGEPAEDADASLRAAWHLAQGRVAHEAGIPPRSLAHIAEARRLLQQAGRERTLTYARTLIRLAHPLRGTQQLDAAAAALDEAEPLLAALGGGVRLELADLHNARTMVSYSRLDREAVVRHARAELDVLRTLGHGSSPAALHALGNLGGILAQLERPAEAEAALREGLRIMQIEPDAAPSAQLGILVNLAALQLTAGSWPAAAETADRGVQAARRFFGARSLRQVTNLVQRAKAQTRQGRWDAALADYALAEDIVHDQPEGASRERMVWIREGQADVYALLGDEPGLLAALQDGLTQSAGTASLRRWRGALLRNQGVYLARRQRWTEAERAFAEAAQVYAGQFGARHAFTLELHAAVCSVQLRSGGGTDGTAAGCAPIVDAPELHARSTPRLRYALHAALAQHAQTAGRHERAQHHLLQALAAAQELGGPQPLWEALHALATELRQQGRHRAAVLLGKQAVQAIETLRGRVHAAAASREGAFLTDKLEVYRRLAAWLAADGRLPEALQVMRLLREEEYDQFMLRAQAGPGAAERQLLTPQEQALAARWTATPGGPGVAGSPADWAQALQALMADAPDAPAAGAGFRPTDAPGSLPSAGVLRVTTIDADDAVTLVLETARRRHAQRLLWPRAQRAAEVTELLARLDAGGDAMPLLRRLYQRIGPALDAHARAAGATRVELALDGALRYLPFAALHDGRAPWGQRLAFVRRPMAGATRMPAAGTAANGVQAFGLTRASGGLPALTSVGAELCAIVDGPVLHDGPQPPQGCAADGRGSGPWPGRAWLDTSFTAGQLERALGGGAAAAGGLLHLGTHFVLRPGNVARSWLLLGDGQRLHLADLGRLDFSGQVLVTLAACETAVGGQQADGREVDGLSSLVLRRGAGAVLASLWRVPDQATRLLMEHFYRELRRHAPERALQRAQAALRAAEGGRWAAPRHWAGFVVARR